MLRRLTIPLRHRLALPFVVLLGLSITAFLTWRTHSSAETRRLLRLQISATQLASLIRARVEIYTALLRSNGALLSDPQHRSRDAFRRYVGALELERHYPGIQGVGFARRVTRDAAQAWEVRIREARPEFRIWPALQHPVGYPIVLLEPEDARNLAAIGYDMYSDPVRHAAMARAAQTGLPSASGKVTLVQEIDENKQAGFLIYVPIYAAASPTAEAPGEGELLGFSYSPFRADDLFRGILGDRPLAGVRFAVYDGEPTADNLLHASDVQPIDPGATSVIRQELEVAGRTWTLLFALESAVGAIPAIGWWFGVGGLVVTSLLALLVSSLERARADSVRHAAELRASEQVARDNQHRKQAIFDAALDGVITVDERARIVEFNLAAERMFGRSRADVTGRPLIEVIFPERYRETYLAGAERQLATGARDLLGRRLELTGLRADGTEFPIEISLSRVELANAVLFTALVRDITDRHAATAHIRELTESLERRVRARTAELEDANRQLESFSYSVSHDLRAPARHVLGYAELLKKQLTGWADPNAQRLVRVITESAGRMAVLIDDLLAFSRTSRQELRRQPVPMRPLVEETIRSLAPEVGPRRIEWRIDQLPTVDGDRALFGLVWTNLLSNAIKYSRPREIAKIAVKAEETPDEFVFHVSDNGTGFDMRYVRKLFGVFSRLHREEEFEGTGIGLANVARIIQRHGGRVWAQGELGVGATFSFSLPRVAPTTPADEPVRSAASRDPWKV